MCGFRRIDERLAKTRRALETAKRGVAREARSQGGKGVHRERHTHQRFCRRYFEVADQN